MNLPFLGHYFLLLALAAALFNIGVTMWAHRRNSPREQFLQLAHRSNLAIWLFLAGASAVLFTLFLTNDFSVKYVWSNSSLSQPLPFKISAFWGGQSGSLLMWAAVLATYGAIVGISGRKKRLEIAPAAVAVISFVNVFFIGLIILQANPFARIEGAVPVDGFGLNPLLQNYWMQIHPPTLYFGYIGCTVPFAFAVAALLHRQFDERWVVLVRRWTLLTWIILFVGIVMGGIWAYETLGWGGYWAWDPVENASLMPWLVLTAFLHSIMLQGRRGVLKNWNMVLISLTFLLSIFGTFLTRSGIVSSVHSFAESDIGAYFLGFLIVAFIATFGLIWWRRDELDSSAKVENAVSREGAFVAGNVLLLAMTFVVLFGTVYPTLYEAMQGVRITVEQQYFNRTVTPIALLILALAGIGPLLSWQRTSAIDLIRKLRAPLWFAVIAIPLAVAPLLYYLAKPHADKWSTGAATALVLSAFLVGAIGSEFWRGAKARQRVTNENFFSALLALPIQNQRRYGGYLVHLGLAVFFVGLTGSSVFKIELEPRDLRIGETLPIGEYTLRFDGFSRPQEMAPQKVSDVAVRMAVMRGDKPLLNRQGQPVVLMPNIEIFKTTGIEDPEAMDQAEQTARRPAILTSPAHDLYLALIGYDMEEGTATIKAYLNPLVMWVWIAVGFFVVGSGVALLPIPGRKKAEEAPAQVLSPLPLDKVATNGRTNGHVNGNGSLRRRAECEAEIEIAIKRTRLRVATTKAEGWQCECGRSMQNEDRFCASCGTPRQSVETSV